MLAKVFMTALLLTASAAFASSQDLGLTDAAEVFLNEQCEGFDASLGAEVHFIDGDADYASYLVSFENAWATVDAVRREATEQDGWPFYEYEVTDHSCSAE